MNHILVILFFAGGQVGAPGAVMAPSRHYSQKVTPVLFQWVGTFLHRCSLVAQFAQTLRQVWEMARSTCSTTIYLKSRPSPLPCHCLPPGGVFSMAGTALIPHFLCWQTDTVTGRCCVSFDMQAKKVAYPGPGWSFMN